MRVIIVFSLSICAIVVVYSFVTRPYLQRSYKSDLTGHSIEVWAYRELYAVPGDAGSGRGFVLLKDEQGKVIEKKKTQLVISIEEPKWHNDHVEIKLFANWRLQSG